MKRLFSISVLNTIACLGLGVFLLFGCSPKREEPLVHEDALAKVNDSVITEAQFKHRWNKRARGDDSFESRSKVLDAMIERTALAQQAIEAGLDKDPIVVETLEGILASRYRELSLFPKIENIEISDEQVATFYEANKTSLFSTPQRIQVAVLWFNSRGQMPLELRYQQRLSEVRMAFAADPVEIDKGFGQLAIKNSEHAASRYRGGLLSALEVGADYDDWRAQVLNIATDLQEPGELSEIVTSAEGVFLVRLIGRQPGSVRPLSEVRERVVKTLKREAREALEATFKASALAGVTMVRFDEALKAIDLNVDRSSSNSDPTFPALQSE